jgi:hypothetical protein
MYLSIEQYWNLPAKKCTPTIENIIKIISMNIRALQNAPKELMRALKITLM